MKLVAIGSILEINQKKWVVLGYNFETNEDQFIMSYIVCAYPLGYVGEESLLTIPVDYNMELIYEGFQDDQFNIFIKSKEELYKLSKNMTVTEWNQHLEEFEREIRREVEGRNG